MVLDQIDSLPTLPAVATRLLNLASRSDTGAREVIEVLSADPSLTTKLIALAQRAVHGIPARANTIEKVVVLMGLDAIRNLALSIKIFETFGPRERPDDHAFDLTEFWKHSLAVACGAQLLAREMGGEVDPEEAFVCGLVHDIGKVALESCLPKSVSRVVQAAEANRASIADIEQQILGIDHTRAGRRLAKRWGLPDSLVQSIWLHHHRSGTLPPSLTARRYVEVVHAADLIAREQRIGYSGSRSYGERASDAAAALGLGTKVLDRVVAQLADSIEKRSCIIGLDVLTSERMYLNALSAANEELAQLNDALTRSNDQLQVRARFFDALRQLEGTICSTSQVREICAAAAGAVAMATDTAGAMVFFEARDDGVCYAGIQDTDGTVNSEMMLQDSVRHDAWQLPCGPNAAPLIPADAHARHVVDAFAHRLGEPPLWLLPLSHEGRLLGGAVFAASHEQASRLSRSADELHALETAIGLALANAEARAAADRFNEELVTINRRMHEAEVELLSARSLASIAEMASGAAHELNNPLAVISGRAQLLSEQVADPETQDALRLVQEHARRCSMIVTELMEFARPRPAQPEAIEATDLFSDIRTFIEGDRELSDSRLEIHVAPDTPPVWADREQVRTIIGELIRNGVEAGTKPPAQLVINCRRDVTDEMIVVEVRDHGRGMTQAVLDHAFDPFYSQRPAGRGRGLGLSRACRLADLNGGRLWLESTEGKGTTACLRLPARVSGSERPSAG